MSRLVDRVLANRGYSFPPWWREAEEIEEMRDVLHAVQRVAEEGQVIVADNVSEYLYAETPQENWDIDNFPCVAPPFPAFWIEWRRPSRVVSETAGLLASSDITPREIAFAVLADRSPEGGWTLGMVPVLDWPESLVARAASSRHPLFAAAFVKLEIDPEGAITDRSCASYEAPSTKGNPDVQEALRTWASMCSSFSNVALLALSFMNCKNVVEEVVAPPPKLSRKHEKRYGRPLASYRVLRIDPMREILRREAVAAGEEGLPRALSICRGHFKTYTGERPLLGRYTGTFWWSPHVRGSAEAGVVEKVYSVASPPAEPAIQGGER